MSAALDDLAAAFGVDNLHVTIGLNNLADLYVAEERYLEAEPLYRRSLAIPERIFGPTDARVAAVCEKRAHLLMKLGWDAEAGVERARARAIREAGEPHIPVATVPPKADHM